MATDGCPLRRIYTDFDIAPPVNSPWAALNYNTGVELAAWMKAGGSKYMPAWNEE